MKKLLYGFGAVFLAIILLSNSVFAQQEAPNFTVESVEEIGEIGKPATVTTRDGGNSAKVGNSLLWLFGDTIFSPKSVDGKNLRANTAALADVNSPLVVREPVDANGAPYQAVPFTQEELEYNQNSTDGSRIAIWPMSVISVSEDKALIYSLTLKIHPGTLNYEFISVNVSEIRANETQAVRITENLFTHPENLFMRAVVKDDNYIYLYDCDKLKRNCFVARSLVENATKRSGFTYWNGSTWSQDINSAVPVIAATSAGFSIAWNNYLGKYIAVYNEIFSNKMYARTSSQPQGPWSEPIELFTGLLPAENTNYAIQLHPELFKENGKRIVVTYYRPGTILKGELRMTEIVLNKAQPCSLKSSGDADCDGVVSLVDFELWRRGFLSEHTSMEADFNVNEAVDLVDFEIWRTYFVSNLTTT